ncbi:MAG: hypothetical protein IJS15_15260 [Victivallales bacterium]|nr:hypothetical protein [Victivallales bacterium]
MKRILLALAIALTFAMAYAQDKVSVSKVEIKEHKGWKEGHKTHRWEEQSCLFSASKQQDYTILYDACCDDSHPGERIPAEGFIGMPKPHAFNWYHHGFFSMKINGNVPFRVPLADMSVLSNGENAIMQMVWDAPEALVQIKFMRVPGDNAIYTQTRWFPKDKVEIKSIQFNFTCYPSCFEKNGKHFARTKTGIKHQGRESLILDVKQNAYVFYGDEVYDAKEGKWGIAAPCYLVMDKFHLASGSVFITSYGVATTINASVDSREARFIFADARSGEKNSEVIEFLEKNGAALQKKLMEISFDSPDIDAFKPEQEQRLIAKSAAEAGEFCKPYKKKIDELFKKLCDAKDKLDTADSWKSERDFAEAYQQYRKLILRLRIDAMMQLD